ncbi:MAG: hypothetical protein PHR12_00515 [Victivallaceae bacterium]|nr:hypothetical protein [Victivallaceae bacterium]MDD5662848.1 hypothetical protein [Victivallaceae bacterium]
MNFIFKSILFVELVFIATCGLTQVVRIQKEAGMVTRNPVVIYQGVQGGEGNLSETISGFLKACGWFEIKTSGTADYHISGEVKAGRLEMKVSNVETGIGLALHIIYDGEESNRKVAKKIVDGILNRLFKVKICESKIAFCAETASGVRNIFICDIDGREVEPITRHTTLAVEPNWSPDTQSLIYSLYGHSYIDVVQTRLRPLQTRRLVSYPGLNSSAAISPNGKYLALIMSFDRKVDLYVKELETDRRIRLTNNFAVEASPAWNPGGGSLCFVSDLNGRPQLYKIDVNSKKITALPTLGNEAVSPDWNAEDVIVYATRMGNYTLAILNMGDTSPAPSGVLIKVGGDWESPSWAPDNRHLICSRRLDGRAELYVVDSWTGKFRKLMNFKYNQSTPAWSKLIQ